MTSARRRAPSTAQAGWAARARATAARMSSGVATGAWPTSDPSAGEWMSERGRPGGTAANRVRSCQAFTPGVYPRAAGARKGRAGHGGPSCRPLSPTRPPGS